VTLAQLNAVLPDDRSTPEHIEKAIGMIEEAGLECRRSRSEAQEQEGGSEARTRRPRRPEEAAVDGSTCRDRGASSPPRPSHGAIVDITRRSTDPVTHDLTQMGEIPLLTREEEISLARKIELTRSEFRREVR